MADVQCKELLLDTQAAQRSTVVLPVLLLGKKNSRVACRTIWMFPHARVWQGKLLIGQRCPPSTCLELDGDAFVCAPSFALTWNLIISWHERRGSGGGGGSPVECLPPPSPIRANSAVVWLSMASQLWQNKL